MVESLQVHVAAIGPLALGALTLRPAARFLWGIVVNDETSPADLEMPQKASEAFTAYVMYGRDRSLAKLAEAEGEGAARVRQLEKWSARYGWQERLKRRAQAELERAAELRREIYLRSLGFYDRKTLPDAIDKLSLADVNSIHDRVRPQEPGVVSVGLGANLTINIGTRPDGPQLQS